MRALIATLVRRLACAIAGHRPSELEAIMLGLDHSVCRCCGREVDE